jgi:hypothetical protein
MRRWMIGALAACALLAVVLICEQQARAGVHVHIGARWPGYYAPYPYYGPYVARYPAPYVVPRVRVYAYPPPVAYGPPAYVPPPPCPRYRVWEW